MFGNAKTKEDLVEESVNIIGVLKEKKETIALVEHHNKALGIKHLRHPEQVHQVLPGLGSALKHDYTWTA